MGDVRGEREGPILWITLDRPHVLNALTRETVAELGRVLAEAADPAVRAVILTGAGRAFCVGHDVRELLGGGLDVADVLRTGYHPVLLVIRSLPKPVVAAVNGPTAGAGLGLALACDVRIASEAATFVPGFAGIGLVPDVGVTHGVARILGPNAFEWLATNRVLTAGEAERRGLVSRAVEHAGLLEHARDLAMALAAGPATAIALTKDLLENVGTRTREAQIELEARAQARAIATEDFREGATAFLEKRPARFGDT